eukprot:scaffold20844_cov16-Tisochrysis_lutea.AAC.1
MLPGEPAHGKQQGHRKDKEHLLRAGMKIFKFWPRDLTEIEIIGCISNGRAVAKRNQCWPRDLTKLPVGCIS